MDSDSKVQRHCRLVAVFHRGSLKESVRENLGAWLDRDWWSLTDEEKRAVDSLGSDDVVGLIDLPAGLGSGAPHRCVVAE